METIIGGILLLGLCIWILIDAHLLRKKPIKVTPSIPGAPYTASEIKQGRYVLIGLSCLSFAIAAAEWLNPHLPPFTGKGSLLYGMLYYVIGPKGASAFWGLLGAGFLLIALFKKPVRRNE